MSHIYLAQHFQKTLLCQGFQSIKQPHQIRKSHRLVRIEWGRSFWSEWRESNPRPHGPEPCALPTALHPDTALPLYGIRFGMSRHIAENPRIELKEFNDGGQEG